MIKIGKKNTIKKNWVIEKLKKWEKIPKIDLIVQSNKSAMYKYYFEKLDVWKISKDLVKEVYDLTGKYPQCENFGIISQIRRSAISVPKFFNYSVSHF